MLSLRIFLLISLFVATPLKAAVSVSVGIEPMRYLIEQLGGERVVVSTLLKSGDPHALDPTPAQLLSLKRADVYFAVGLPFEHSLGDRLGEAEKLVWLNQRDEHSPRTQDEQGEGQHAGHEKSGHEHQGHELGLDPHRWTAPVEMLRMGKQVVAVLSRFDPEGAAYYGQREQAFVTLVAELQTRIRSRLASIGGAMVANHPAWGWFCEEFSLQQLAVEQQGKLPSIRQMSALKKDISSSGARHVVSEHGGAQAQTLATLLGLDLLVVNPLSYDWEAALDTLSQGLAKP